LKLDDALFNWLQIKTVADARPDDNAAKETADFFYTILTEDHQVSQLRVDTIGADMLQIVYEVSGETRKKSFDRQMTEQLLHDINENPKYNE